jgi:hypothetical protein
MRFDSGFWSNATIATLGRLGVGYTMGVRMVKSVVTAISAIDEESWTPIDYTCDGIAEVAECVYKGVGSWCAGPGWSDARRPCGPSGATSPS